MFYKGFLAVIFVFWSCKLMSQNDKAPLEIYESISKNKNLNALKKKELLDSLIFGNKNNIDQDKLVQVYHDLLKSFYREDINVSIDYALKIKAIGESINNHNDFYLKNDNNKRN